MSFNAVHMWLQQVELYPPPEGVEPLKPSALASAHSTKFQSASFQNGVSAVEVDDMKSLPPLSDSYYSGRIQTNGGMKRSLSPVSESNLGIHQEPQVSVKKSNLVQVDYDMKSLSPLSNSASSDRMQTSNSVESLPPLSESASLQNGGSTSEIDDMKSVPPVSDSYFSGRIQTNGGMERSLSPVSESNLGIHQEPQVSVKKSNLVQVDYDIKSLSPLSNSASSDRMQTSNGVESLPPLSESASLQNSGVRACHSFFSESISTTSELGGVQKSDGYMGAQDSTDEGLISDYSASSATSDEEAQPPPQASPTAPAPPLATGTEILGDPFFWSGAWSSLKLLKPHASVDLCILDYHFMAEWLERKETLVGHSIPSAYYIDSKVLRNLENYISGEPTLRRRLFITQECTMPMHPVFLFNSEIQGLGNQLFILDFSERCVLVLGGINDRTPTSPSRWLDQLWSAIAGWFGWSSEPLEGSKIFYRGWTEGDLQFGPRVTSLFESAVKGEWTWSKDIYGGPEKPTFQCDRLMLQQIFIKTLGRCLTYTQHWQTLHVEKLGVWEEVQMSTMEEVNIGLLSFRWVEQSAAMLCRNIQACRSCTERSSHLPADAPLPGIGHAEAETSISPRPEISDEQSQNSQDSAESILDLPALPQENLHSAKNGPIENRVNVWHFDKEDDDYTTSPIHPLKSTPPESSNIWVFGSGGMVPLLPRGLFNWTDRGFRTTRLFFRTIQTALPAETTLQRAAFPNTPTIVERCRPPLQTRVLPISGGDILDKAGVVSGTDISRRTFVRGREERKPGIKPRYLALDLEQDGVDIAPDCVKVSVDLDSLIWVTTAANFTVKSFELFLTPKTTPGVGIDKNNFIYVGLLSPPANPTELDDPMRRARTQVPLSRIPHLEFGYCGQGSRRINFYAFFPRMIWKNDKGRYATRLPGHLTDLWYDSAILAACCATYTGKPGFSEYQPRNLQEIRDRTGMGKRKEVNVVGGNQKKLMEELLRIIRENDSLSCFGSFFIVADGRGMKFSTKQCALPGESAPSFDLIKAEFSDLNWEVMQDREKGELYLDIGTGYHSEHEIPLVGFWRLPRLLDAFEQRGSKKPTIFHFGTQKFHGGMSAEMSIKSKNASHFISGIYYCLAFEVVRSPGTSDYICSDADAVGRSTRFHTQCQKWLSLTSAAGCNPYGVREEVRGLAGTVLKRLEHSVEQAKEFLKSNPILWIPSVTYFGIVTRRFRELLKVHEQCFELRLPNYRLMSILLTYLLRHTMVTPRVTYPELDTALEHICFKEVITMCGIFFLHGLHSKSMRITGLLESDSTALTNAFKSPFVEKKPNPQHGLELLPAIEAGDYPWGMALSELTIKVLLNGSLSFMKAIHYEEGVKLVNHPLSSRIFRTFSAQVWMMLSEDFVQKPKIQATLQGAISQWTLESVKQTICRGEVIVHPTYDALSTPNMKLLRPKQLFANRKEYFFPVKDAVGLSQCSAFANNAGDYLALYYEQQDAADHVSMRTIDDDLDRIFGLLPLLPASQPTSSKSKFTHDIWTTTKGKIEFVANSIYFKCNSVTFTKKANPSEVRTRRAKLNQAALVKRVYENVNGPNSHSKRRGKAAAVGKRRKYRKK